MPDQRRVDDGAEIEAAVETVAGAEDAVLVPDRGRVGDVDRPELDDVQPPPGDVHDGAGEVEGVPLVVDGHLVAVDPRLSHEPTAPPPLRSRPRRSSAAG